jgi:SpoVK/Ycf46/Vps4 family AAA+-type ATPase
MVNQMLTELEGVKANDRPIYLLAATNLPDAVDPAILSRFDDRIEIPLPDPAQRQQLLRIFIGRRKVDFDVDELVAAIAPETSHMGGRDLRKLVERATQKAVGRALKAGTPGNVVLTRDDVLGALGGTKGAGTG